MASARYTLNITPDPPEEKHVMTPAEKRKNFWYYNKWYIIGGGVALVLLAFFIHDVIVGNVEPDYQIGILSPQSVPDVVCSQLEEALTPLCDDRNGDGNVVVSVVTYHLSVGESSEGMDESSETVDVNEQMASVTRLSVDLQDGESMLFLTDDVAAYNAAYGMFAYNDGTTCEQDAAPDTARLGMRWGDCPVLCSLALGDITDLAGNAVLTSQDFLQDYLLVRRAYTGTSIDGNPKTQSAYDSAMALFETLTKQ